MFADVTSVTVNPMFLRHDLMIELGRLETAIDSMRDHVSANSDLAVLKSRRETLSDTLQRLSA